MLKKTIEYEGFDEGQKFKEDFYFNLTKTELSKLQLSHSGGFLAKLQRITSAQDMPEIADVFTDIIDMSYGIKSDDGKRFVKSPEILANFKSTNAYDVLFSELISDVRAAIEFINAVIPKEMSEQIKKNPEYIEEINEITSENS